MDIIPIRRTRSELLTAVGYGGVGAIAAASIFSDAVVAASADAKLLTAWNERQSALAEIESRGLFYSSESHSPHALARFDAAVMEVHEAEAATLRGVLVKLWQALSLAGGQIISDEDQAMSDAIRRADFGEVASFADELEFEVAALWSAVSSLTAIVEAC